MRKQIEQSSLQLRRIGLVATAASNPSSRRTVRPYPDIRRVDHRFTAASPNRSFIHRAAFSDGEGQERGTEQSSPLRNWSDAALASNFFVGAQGEAYIWILEQVPH